MQEGERSFQLKESFYSRSKDLQEAGCDQKKSEFLVKNPAQNPSMCNGYWNLEIARAFDAFCACLDFLEQPLGLGLTDRAKRDVAGEIERKLDLDGLSNKGFVIMNLWDADKLVLFLLFFIPGFVSIKVYDLIVPGERRDWSKSLFDAVAYSSLNFAALSWLIVLACSKQYYSRHRFGFLVVVLFVVFLIPAAWPVVLTKVSTLRALGRHVVHPVKKPWDFVFGNRVPYWVIVHLKDTRKIGGKYGHNSFSSSYPYPEQIYLEQVWKLDEDGRFLNPIHGSRGIIILQDEIASVELFDG